MARRLTSVNRYGICVTLTSQVLGWTLGDHPLCPLDGTETVRRVRRGNLFKGQDMPSLRYRQALSVNPPT